MLCGPSATSGATSTPRFIGPGCITIASGLARASRSGLVVLSQQRLSGSHAEVVLEMQSSNAHFSGPPVLLEELEIRAVLARHRALPIDRTVLVRLGTRAA